ncbi:MAG: acyl-CoA dehydrogenase family protein [Alcanivoracaceae bacterium]|jgi:alkylation response protein AidB-like acyl-CoA dehydrogenase|nr:acyl-CoA dehydrogenase family protein [Alcanivoracaceae bacterium]
MNSLDVQTPELTLLGDQLRRFLERNVVPHYDQWERAGKMPRELWNQLGEQGFLGADVAESFGGAQAGYAAAACIIRAVADAGLAGLASAVAAHNEVAIPYINDLGSDAQRQRWLPGMLSGDIVGAIAMTEPGAGSDLKAIRGRAEKISGGWRLNGQKTFITNGIHADLIIVAMKSDPDAGAKGISLFLVPADTPGFSRGRKLEKLGQNIADTAELFFENVLVGDDALLGGEGQGFACLMKELPRERLSFAIAALGACDAVLADTLAYVQQRKAFGVPVAQFQNTRFRLAELHARVEVLRAFVNQCIDRQTRAELNTRDVSIAKLVSSELQCELVDACLQLFGGYGYMKEYRISRAYVDARGQRIYGGTSEIMKEIIARELLGR